MNIIDIQFVIEICYFGSFHSPYLNDAPFYVCLCVREYINQTTV